MLKKYINVRLEVDFYNDEDEGRMVQSVLPISVDLHDFSEDDMRDTLLYLRHDDDASFDFMWDLRHLLLDEMGKTDAKD